MKYFKRISLAAIVFSASLILFSGNAFAITSPFTTALKLIANTDTASAADNAELELGSGSFTIEFFFKLGGNADAGTGYFLYKNGGYILFAGFGAGAADRIRFQPTTATLSTATTGDIFASSLRSVGVTINAGTWYHIAVVRDSGTGFLYIFLDGTLVGQCTIAGTFGDGTNLLRIGGTTGAGDTLGNGSGAGMEEVRFATTADYTANFTPTTSAFADCTHDGQGDAATTTNLWHFDTGSTTTDSCGSTANTLTFNGTTTTAITLASLTATPSDGKVVIDWETATESNNAGFNIYRSETKDGEYIQINDTLIPGAGDSVSGSTYNFSDNNVEAGKLYFYKLEDVDNSGNKIMNDTIVSASFGDIEIISPDNGGNCGKGMMPKFEWEMGGMRNFMLQFSTNPDFSGKIYTITKVAKKGSKAGLNLPKKAHNWIKNKGKGGSVYWRIIGKGSGSNKTSEVRTLSVN